MALNIYCGPVPLECRLVSHFMFCNIIHNRTWRFGWWSCIV